MTDQQRVTREQLEAVLGHPLEDEVEQLLRERDEAEQRGYQRGVTAGWNSAARAAREGKQPAEVQVEPSRSVVIDG